MEKTAVTLVQFYVLRTKINPSKLVIGCGYLGTRVAQSWLNAGHSVAALTRSTERAKQFERQSIQPVLGDVTQLDSLGKLPSCKTLLYAVGFDRNADQDKRTVYVDGLRNVLRCMHGRFERIVYISSSSVYGQTQGEWVDESSVCKPTSEGGQICLAAEQVLRDECNGHVEWLTLRLSGIYGPDRFMRSSQALSEATPIGGNPDSWLNLIHVDDAVQAVLASEVRGTKQLYLVSDGEPVLRRDFYSELSKASGNPEPVFDNAKETRRARPAGSLNKRCSNKLMLDELRVTLEFPNYQSGLSSIF